MPITFRVTQDFAVPPERVFTALTDLDGARAWMPGLVRIVRLDHDASHPVLSVGSRWRGTRRMFGREATEEFEVTHLDPPLRLALRVDGSKGSSRRGEFLFDYTLQPVAEGGSRVLFDGEIRGLGPVWELVGRLFGGVYRSACAKDLQALASHLDEEESLVGDGESLL